MSDPCEVPVDSYHNDKPTPPLLEERRKTRLITFHIPPNHSRQQSKAQCANYDACVHSSRPELHQLICYRVLQTGHDPRAIDLLKPACSLLQARAAQLPDENDRQAFLDNDIVHRAIVQAWNSLA